MSKQVIRPATRFDVIAIRGELYDHSFRGLAVEVDGEVLAIAGVMMTSPLQLFSTIDDEVRKYPRLFVKTGRLLQKMLSEYDTPIYALPEAGRAKAKEFLTWLGFKPSDRKHFYVWENRGTDNG